MKFRIVILLLLIILSSSAQAAVDEHGNLQIKNDYISIIVNQNEQNTGRFAVDVTGGNPMHDRDDGKPLIYGRPQPWTSYTTIKIDGKNYIFGGQTDKRAGKTGNYGTQVKAPYITEQGSIETIYKYNNIKVIQSLSFVKSNTTGLPDTAQIKYQVINNDDQSHKVGLRAMLDTMLGDNDGAPFRIGSNAVTTDQLYTKEELPIFWQAFDQLNDPAVTAQGTIKGPQVTAPDKLYVADWGSLADGAWSFDYNQGEEFMRKGEFELDSALALFWDSKPLSAGKSRTYVTNYGLGGITTVPGLLSVGVSSPAKVVLNKQNKTFPVLTYIQNTAEIEAKEVKAEIDLPEGLKLAAGESQQKVVGNLSSASTGQIVWQVEPDSEVTTPKELQYSVEVTAENTDDNSVSRSVEVIGPPQLDLSLSGPEELTVKNKQLVPNPFTVVATIKNSGASSAYDPSVSMELPPGLKLASGEKRMKYLGYLEAGEKVEIPWMLESVGIDGSLPYAIEMKSINTQVESDMKFLEVPQLQSEVYLESATRRVRVGDTLKVYFKAANIADFYRLSSQLNYDPTKLDVIYISRGTLFAKADQLLNWQYQLNKKGSIEISGNLESEEDVFDTVATLYFKVKKAGPININFNKLNINNELGKEVEYSSNSLTVEARHR
ncbi:MAG: cohesin domain-containing protein [Bacillota bacterium]